MVSYVVRPIDGKMTLIRKDEAPSLDVARSGMPAPMLALDGMEPTQHPADGQHYTSKAKFREVTRANQMIEVGNDPARFRHQNPVKPDRAGIRQSLEKAMAQVNSR